MNDQNRLPFLPMSDDEGYYIRDPQAVFIRTDQQFRVFVAHLLALADGIDAVEVVLQPEQHELTQQVKDELASLQGTTKMLLALVRGLAGYNIKLTEQRQSARVAFDAGWEARYQDIIRQLHSSDHRMLRWIIEHLAHDEDETDLPF